MAVTIRALEELVGQLQLAEQVEVAPTLVIGLGGSGTLDGAAAEEIDATALRDYPAHPLPVRGLRPRRFHEPTRIGGCAG